MSENNDELTSVVAELEKKIEEQDREIKRLARIATDRRYMMDAYKAMLGPIALQLSNQWEDKGVLRQHTYWGPEAASLSGEERAKALLDAESAVSFPLDFNDSKLPTIDVRDWIAGKSE